MRGLPAVLGLWLQFQMLEQHVWDNTKPWCYDTLGAAKILELMEDTTGKAPSGSSQAPTEDVDIMNWH